MVEKIENNINNWSNLEKKNWNWFQEKRESIKNFLEWRKKIDETKMKEEITEKSEKLKNSTIDSTLDNLQLDTQKRLELQDSQTEIKKELDDVLFEWSRKKDSKETVKEKELFERLLKENKFKTRSPEAIQQIANSATKIESEIKNWKQETNPVARSLLKIVNWIMSTEKNN